MKLGSGEVELSSDAKGGFLEVALHLHSDCNKLPALFLKKKLKVL